MNIHEISLISSQIVSWIFLLCLHEFRNQDVFMSGLVNMGLFSLMFLEKKLQRRHWVSITSGIVRLDHKLTRNYFRGFAVVTAHSCLRRITRPKVVPHKQEEVVPHKREQVVSQKREQVVPQKHLQHGSELR